MSAREKPEPCPAHRHDDPEGPVEERVICMHEPQIRGAWGFICRDCWDRMLDAKARREEWRV